MEKLTHGSLFSGIGGFDLAAEWMGWENKFHCEWNEFGQKVLHHYWPEAECFTDITKSDFKKYYGKIDILTGGFPCQPYSSAGKRKGKEDERHLWPEMLRAIREISPRFVVGENVRGLTNWNGGVVFEEVCADLEAEGYEVWTGILAAAGVGAPHRRERIWFVAHAHGGADLRTPERDAGTGASEGVPERHEVRIPDQSGDVWDVADTDSTGFKKRIAATESGASQFGTWHGGADDGNADGQVSVSVGTLRQRGNESAGISGQSRWDRFPTEPPVCGGDDGLPRELDGITFSKWRNESIKAYGNAIVPQVAYQIFQAIQNANEQY